jgi:hypothetical protein
LTRAMQRRKFNGLWAAAAAAVVAAACGSTSATPAGPPGACPSGQTSCPTCRGGSICANACPGFACPVALQDGGAVGDASADAGSGGGACPVGSPVSCTDCNGGTFCVAGTCPGSSCPVVDAGSDAPAQQAGGPCGQGRCAANQLCVTPSCGGGTPPNCILVPDSGVCPTGTAYSSMCTLLGTLRQGPGCLPPPCTPAGPFCVDIPASCGAKPTCACLPSTICGSNGGQCGAVYVDGTVWCGSA